MPRRHVSGTDRGTILSSTYLSWSMIIGLWAALNGSVDLVRFTSTVGATVPFRASEPRVGNTVKTEWKDYIRRPS